MRSKVILSIIFLPIVLLVTSSSVFAVELSIARVPETISSDPFAITVTVSGAGTGTNYLRVDLYRPSTTVYFGETYNGQDWYDGSDHTQYAKADIESGSLWSDSITAQLGDAQGKGYDGKGEYMLRVRRYTESGRYSVPEANLSAIPVIIAEELEAQTPTPTQAEGPSGSPTQASRAASDTPQSTLTPSPISHDKIYLSEAMVYPESGEREWVELYNGNEYEAVLDSWYLDDGENTGSSPKVFTMSLPPTGYGVFELTSSIFNNTGDTVRLLDFNKLKKDSFTYTEVNKGKTVGRVSFNSSQFCMQNATRGSENDTCIASTPTPTPTKKITPTPSSKLESIEGDVEKEEEEEEDLSGSEHPEDVLLNFSSFVSDDNGGNGEILGEEDQLQKMLMEKSPSASYHRSVAYVKGFAVGSYFISLLNIFYILHRMIKQLAARS